MTDEQALRFDEEVSAILRGSAGAAADPLALWLASAARPTPPPSLAARLAGIVEASIAAPAEARVEARVETRTTRRASPRDARPRLALRLVAAALALAFASQGVGSILFGDWVGDNLGEHSPHAMYELGLALMAAGVCVGAAALHRAWAPVAVTAGAPLGLGLGIHGLGEIGTFAAGAVLHSLEGLLALALVAAWWADRRYTRRSRREGGA
jgi:hypothetical protein